jgi:hypothetical protein
VKARLSPTNEPIAATTNTAQGFGVPVATPIAATATTTGSLGIGGKNPSRATSSSTTRRTNGDAAQETTSSLSASTEIRSVGKAAPDRTGRAELRCLRRYGRTTAGTIELAPVLAGGLTPATGDRLLDPIPGAVVPTAWAAALLLPAFIVFTRRDA